MRIIPRFRDDVEAEPDDLLYQEFVEALAELERLVKAALNTRSCIICREPYPLTPPQIVWWGPTDRTCDRGGVRCVSKRAVADDSRRSATS